MIHNPSNIICLSTSSEEDCCGLEVLDDAIIAPVGRSENEKVFLKGILKNL
jgi:hypothetical protein